MENKENRNGLEIDISHVLKAVWHRLWLILLVGVLAGAVAFCYAKFVITPTYSSSVQLYVNNQYPDSPGFSSSQLQASQILADTYMVILESRNVLTQVNEVAGLNYSYGQLKSMVTAQAVNETEVFTVTVTCTNAMDAYRLAKAVSEVLPAKIDAVVDGSSVRVVDYAVLNKSPVGPNYTRHALLGTLIGIVLSLLLTVIEDALDTRVHSEEYLTAAYGDVPLLAVIPPAEGGDKYGYKSSYRAKTAQTEKAGRAEE